MKQQKITVIHRILLFILAVGVITVLLFTANEMGVFTGEPAVEIQAEYANENVPALRIATDYDFCPNAYYNSNNELSGLYIEVMNEVANRIGMKPEFLAGTWIQSRERLTSGEADVLLGLEIFSNMEGTLRTIPISSDELYVYGKKKVSSAAALAGKKVALMARSVIISTFDLQCEYKEYYTNTEILEAVENGEADYGICHGAVSKKIIEKNHLNLIRGVAIMKSFPALAVRASESELQKKLNAALQDMAEDGTLYRLKTKWIDDFTKDRSFGYVLKDNQAFYIASGMGLLLLILLTVFFQVYSKKQEAYIAALLSYQQQLQISNKNAEQANRAKTEFLSHMSHDIRTPLNGIMGMAGIMRTNTENRKRIVECLDNIDIASQHLLYLINDVLDMSKLESGDVELEHETFSLDQELKHIHTIVDSKAQEKQIDLQICTEQVSHRDLVGSPGHLRRILINLLGNALKYTPEKGRVCVQVTELPKDEKNILLEIKVQDNGIGMSREFVKNRLYKPFTQESDGARTKYQGTGLGMAIVHKLVDIMQGTIQVESEPGNGTTFTVTLPFEIAETKEIPKTDTKTEKDISGMHILLAEDNELNREIAEYILKENGAEVVSVQDGKQTVEQFAASKEGSFDAVLMDIMMPVLDGIEAARAIRHLERKDAESVPIIAMTANAFAEDKKKSADAGMNAHLTKPLDSAVLLETLARYRNRI